MSVLTRHAVWFRGTAPTRFLETYRKTRTLLRSRKALSRLDDHLLRDIGLSRAEASTEAARRDWNPPLHWRC